jgi:hypothetical protein
MPPNPVVTLHPAIRPAALLPSLQPNGRLQCSQALSASDCVAVDAFLAEHPEVWLRVFQQASARSGPRLDFLARLPALRHVWIEAGSGGFNDLSDLAFLPAPLVALCLDTLAPPGDKRLDKAKRGTEALARFAALQELMLCGALSNLAFLADLPALKRLRLQRSKLESLRGIEKATQLEHLELNASGAKSLAPLADLRALKSLEIWNQRGLSELDALAGLQDLRRLWLVSCGRDLALPSFARLRALRVLVLHSICGSEQLERVAQAPGLRCLILSGPSDLRSPEDFQPLAGHPSLRELRIDGWDEGLAAAITARFGWKVAIANWPADEHLD